MISFSRFLWNVDVSFGNCFWTLQFAEKFTSCNESIWSNSAHGREIYMHDSHSFGLYF